MILLNLEILRNNIKSSLKTAYRKTGTRDPSGTLAGPYKNRETGTLVGPYKNRKTRTRDLSGILKKSGIITAFLLRYAKVNVNEM